MDNENKNILLNAIKSTITAVTIYVEVPSVGLESVATSDSVTWAAAIDGVIKFATNIDLKNTSDSSWSIEHASVSIASKAISPAVSVGVDEVLRVTTDTSLTIDNAA